MTDNNAPASAIDLLKRGWAARREGKYAEAHRDVGEAIALLRQSGARGDLAQALGMLGHMEMDLKRWDEARALYEEAVSVCRDEGDPLNLAHKIRHLGDVHRHAGRLDDAEACYQEALLLYRNHMEPPKLDYANAIRPAAILKEELGQVDQARELWIRGERLYEAVDIQEGVDECTDRLAGLSP